MSVDLDTHLIDLGQPRDQGSRPTCISFAISDVHRSKLNLAEDLSPESLHRAAAAFGGTDIESPVSDFAALAALKATGQTTEIQWPYNTPVCTAVDAAFYKRSGMATAFDVDRVAAAIIAKMPIVVILDIGEEFFLCVDDTPLRAANIRPVEACHAVVLTGLQKIEDERHFRVRNSWGAGWGNQGQIWASASYILARSPSIVRID